MTMLYRHFQPSTTSLSDEYDDEEPGQSNFFNGDQPLLRIDAAIQPHWSSSQSEHSVSKPAVIQSPIAAIPAEVLIYVLKHLHQPRDLLSALRVSRTWCECAVELLWHKPAFSRYPTVEKMVKQLKSQNQTFTYSKFIRRLNFLPIADLRDDTFKIFYQCDRLERLTLNGCKLLTAPALEETLTHFPNLVSLDLTNVKETNNEVIIAFAATAKRLLGINLQACKKVDDSAMFALAQNCPLLRRVKLNGLELITDEGVSALVKGCPLLLEIDLHQCQLVTDVSIRDIWMHSINLRELRLSMCTNLTDLAFPAPVRLETTTDRAGANPFPQRQDSTDLPPLFVTQTFEQLRMLDLTSCAKITDDAVEGIVLHAPKIRSLVLSKCTQLTDRSVEAICNLGRNLHYLHLGHASKITDRSVKNLARSCNRIRYVDFANCTNLTDMSVFELSALPKLRRIGLVRVNNLTDEAIYALAERHATLERIHLSYCDQISVLAVHFLLLKLHKLTHLSLTGVPAFRQADLQRFCREAPKDYNSAQRQSFCVYSGKGISQLRTYLTELFDRITEQNGTDDTEYDEEEDDDTVAFQENESPEPEAAEVDDDVLLEPADARQQGTRSAPRARRDGPSRYEVPQHALGPENQRQRSLRMLTIPTLFGPNHQRISATNRAQAESTVQGATSVLQQQLQQASTSRRDRGPGAGPRAFADMLPILESPTSPHDPRQLSSPFNPDNHPVFHPPPSHGALPGARTPDLNFAEIGRGRGVQPYTVEPSRAPRRRHPVFEAEPSHIPANPRASNFRAMSDPGIHPATHHAMTYSRPNGIRQDQFVEGVQADEGLRMVRTQRRRDNVRSPNGSDGSRPRSQLRSRIRNGLHTAENYASSFFSRTGMPPPPDVQDPDVNSQHPQQPPSGRA